QDQRPRRLRRGRLRGSRLPPGRDRGGDWLHGRSRCRKLPGKRGSQESTPTSSSTPHPPNLEDLSEQVRARYQQPARIRDRRVNRCRHGSRPAGRASDRHARFDAKTKEALEAAGERYSVSGRVMAIRDFGKAAFVRLKDRTGLIQLFVQRDKLTEKEYA